MRRGASLLYGKQDLRCLRTEQSLLLQYLRSYKENTGERVVGRYLLYGNEVPWLSNAEQSLLLQYSRSYKVVRRERRGALLRGILYGNELELFNITQSLLLQYYMFYSYFTQVPEHGVNFP